MADFDHPDVKELLAEANFAVVSSHNPDGSILSTVTWIDYADGVLAVNSMVGRAWPSNLERDPQITALVMDMKTGNRFVEIRGTASGTLDGAVDHIEALAQKYTGAAYSWPKGRDVQRQKFVIAPSKVRYFSTG